MIHCNSIHHVSLNVRDRERARAFYSDILGLQPLARPPFQTDGLWYAIGDQGQQLHLIVYPGETLREGKIDGSDGHFALRVRSYQETIDWLQHHDIEYIAKPDSIAGFAQIFIKDPDHNVIEFNVERE